MNIAIISDIHSNAPALATVLEEIEKHDCDRILCAGDLVGYNAAPNRTIELLSNNDTIAIRGNHDEAVLTETPSEFNIPAKRAIDWTRRELNEDNRQFLEELDYDHQETIDDLQIYMAHGSPIQKLSQYIRPYDLSNSVLNRWFDSPPDVIILGHTHQQYVEEVEDTIVVNPGSVGQPRDGDPRAAFSILDTNSRQIHNKRVKYNIDKTAKATKTFLPRRLADRLYEGR